MKYKLLALDIDGTLIGRNEVVSQDTVDALAVLERQGMRICLATGRAYNAAMPIWQQLRLTEPHEPLVLMGGALVTEGATGRTLCMRAIARDLACEYGRSISQAGYCMVAAYDPWRHDLDYLRTVGGAGEAVLQKWLVKQKVKVAVAANLESRVDLPNPLRMSSIITPADAPELTARLAEQFRDRLNIYSLYVPAYDFTVVEALSATATKLSGLTYVAQAMRVGAGAMVAVGDDMNDLAMVAGAGLGVAMPQAPQALRDAAKHVAADGLTRFLLQLADGKFN